MPAALLTLVCFAVTAVFARRAALLLGAAAANFWRLLVAAALLGAWAALGGHGWGAAGMWFFVSGLVGFGLGGLAMFHALPRAGANLATLTVQCGAVLVALVVEWVWLSVSISPSRGLCLAAILGGVVLGLAPRSFPQFAPRALLSGAALAALSAVGQGVGQVISRKAYGVLRAAGVTADPGTVTCERVLAGLLVAAVALVVTRMVVRARAAGAEPAAAEAGRRADVAGSTLRASAPWVLANALTGPVLGVTCLQWALSQKEIPAAVVQSVVAMAPLLTAPLARRLGEDVPHARYFAGAALAVAGSVALWWVG